MATNLSKTTHFGLTRIGNGEPQSKNGWAFSDADRVRIDNLLWALATHHHDGDPALGDPTGAPGLVVNPTGGRLTAASTYYYKVSFVDRNNLETASSPEAAVTTPSPLASPVAPSTAIETTSGTVAAGLYSYVITFVDSFGGETTPSPMGTASVRTGSTNRVRLNFPQLPTGAASINVYRSRPGQSQFYYLGQSATTSFFDSGQAEDQTIFAPTVNTTNNSSSIEVTIPGEFIPLGCFGWRIYRASATGVYGGNSLVHYVTEGVTDTSTTPRITWVDSGDALLAGSPSAASSTMPDGAILRFADIQGEIPVAAMPRGGQTLTVFGAGAITNNRTLSITEAPRPVKPVRMTAFFKTDVVSGEVVKFRFTDSGVNTVQTVTLSGTAVTDYVLTYPGSGGTRTTTLIPYGSPAANVQSALEALTPIGVGNVVVDGNPGGPYSIEFVNALENLAVPQLTGVGGSNQGTVTVVRTVVGSTTGSYVELECSSTSHRSGDATGFYRIEWPLIDDEEFEAEEAGRYPDVTTTPIVSDLAAISGQAVSLASNGSGISIALGTLEKGDYRTFVNLRVVQYATSSTNDLVMRIRRADTNVTVGSELTYTLTDPGDGTGGLYIERNGPQFSALGGIPYYLDIEKGASTVQAYNVSTARFQATAPALKPGLLTATSTVTGTATAADVNVALWF